MTLPKQNSVGVAIAAVPTIISRRAFAIGASITLLLAGCGKGSVAKGVFQPAAEAPADPAFLDLSRRLTGHADLDPQTAARMSQAFDATFPEIKARLAALAALAQNGMAPAQILAAAQNAGLAEPALAIVAAWYKGSVGLAEKAVTFAYADALMNRPVADGVAPPTYQLGGPGWWTAAPPVVGLSRPVERLPVPTTPHVDKKS
jgi:hypothetical protein